MADVHSEQCLAVHCGRSLVFVDGVVSCSMQVAPEALERMARMQAAAAAGIEGLVYGFDRAGDRVGLIVAQPRAGQVLGGLAPGDGRRELADVAIELEPACIEDRRARASLTWLWGSSRATSP